MTMDRNRRWLHVLNVPFARTFWFCSLASLPVIALVGLILVTTLADRVSAQSGPDRTELDDSSDADEDSTEKKTRDKEDDKPSRKKRTAEEIAREKLEKEIEAAREKIHELEQEKARIAALKPLLEKRRKAVADRTKWG
jgi:FtsZ-interacting cell division protein ZipA